MIGFSTLLKMVLIKGESNKKAKIVTNTNLELNMIFLTTGLVSSNRASFL